MHTHACARTHTHTMHLLQRQVERCEDAHAIPLRTAPRAVTRMATRRDTGGHAGGHEGGHADLVQVLKGFLRLAEREHAEQREREREGVGLPALRRERDEHLRCLRGLFGARGAGADPLLSGDWSVSMDASSCLSGG